MARGKTSAHSRTKPTISDASVELLPRRPLVTPLEGRKEDLQILAPRQGLNIDLTVEFVMEEFVLVTGQELTALERLLDGSLSELTAAAKSKTS